MNTTLHTRIILILFFHHLYLFCVGNEKWKREKNTQSYLHRIYATDSFFPLWFIIVSLLLFECVKRIVIEFPYSAASEQQNIKKKEQTQSLTHARTHKHKQQATYTRKIVQV